MHTECDQVSQYFLQNIVARGQRRKALSERLAAYLSFCQAGWCAEGSHHCSASTAKVGALLLVKSAFSTATAELWLTLAALVA